jgi:hypothetical protein
MPNYQKHNFAETGGPRHNQGLPERSSLKHYSLHSFPALIVAPGIIFQPLSKG